MSTQFLLSLAIRFAGLARVKRVTIEEKEQPETLALPKPGAMRKKRSFVSLPCAGVV